jgi:hypothetical protein
MTIEDFVSSHCSVSPNSDILSRWDSRIVAQGLHVAGRRGAESYLGQYGKGLKSPKAVGLARCAEIKGFPLVAARFWEEAFYLATGNRGTFSGSAATPAAPVASAPVAVKSSFGRYPQLPCKTTAAAIDRMIADDRYGMQEKFDGRNTMVDVTGGKVSAGNKKGLGSAIPLEAADAAAAVSKDWKFDAENVNGVLYVFDVIEFEGVDLSALPYVERHSRLAAIQKKLPADSALRIVNLVRGRAAKLAFRDELRSRGAEGFVLKFLSADYSPGDGHEAQFKSQFRERGTFISGAQNGLKSSVAISVLTASGQVRDMGNLTVPRIFPVGSILEVEYLYCHEKGGKLHQPVFIEVRSDANASDCQESKLKVKGVGDSDEGDGEE